MVARRQVRGDEPGWRRGDGPKFLRPVVTLQRFPIGEPARINDDGDVRPWFHQLRPGATRARRGDGQRVVMGGVSAVNKSDVLILQPARMAEVTLELRGRDDFREAAFPRGVIGYPTGRRIDGAFPIIIAGEMPVDVDLDAL